MTSRIGKYTIEKELGHGGFGRVYLAHDPDVGRKVAIKLLRVEYCADPDMLKRFLHEIPTTGGLRHPNIVTIYASGEESGNPYLVMEYLEGQTLRQVIQDRRPLTLLDKVRIMNRVADGLAYAHSRDIVHRDVKPENIMLLPDGSVKIMDFGIALTPGRITSMTQSGGMIGTPCYFAPEQIRGGKANEQTDIFSFGDVYYELLTGRHPFQAFLKDWMALQAGILTHDPPLVGRIAPPCPEALELLVHRTLAKAPELRYQKFEEVLLDGEAVLLDLQQARAAEILREIGPLKDAGDPQAAVARVRQALQLDPGNREARRLRDELMQDVQKVQIVARLGELCREAEKCSEERRFAETVQTLEAAERLDPADSGVRERLADARKKLDCAVRAARLVSEARLLQQQRQPAEARERAKSALAVDAGSPEAKDLIQRLGDQLLQQALRSASQHLEAKRFAEALAALAGIPEELHADGTVTELHARIEQEAALDEKRRRFDDFHRALGRARDAVLAGELDAGRLLDELSAAFAVEPGAPELIQGLRELWRAQLSARELAAIRRQASTLIEQKSFSAALPLLEDALRRFPREPGLERLKVSVEESLSAHQRAEGLAAVLAEAAARRGAGDLAGAQQALAASRLQFGEDAALLVLARQIEQQAYAAGLGQLLAEARELIAGARFSAAIDRLLAAVEYTGEAEVRAILDSARAAQVLQLAATTPVAATELAETRTMHVAPPKVEINNPPRPVAPEPKRATRLLLPRPRKQFWQAPAAAVLTFLFGLTIFLLQRTGVIFANSSGLSPALLLGGTLSASVLFVLVLLIRHCRLSNVIWGLVAGILAFFVSIVSTELLVVLAILSSPLLLGCLAFALIYGFGSLALMLPPIKGLFDLDGRSDPPHVGELLTTSRMRIATAFRDRLGSESRKWLMAFLWTGLAVLLLVAIQGASVYRSASELEQNVRAGTWTDEQIWSQWKQLESSSLFSWLLSPARTAVKQNLMAAADRVIVGYRNGNTITENAWNAAANSLFRTIDMDPDLESRGKQKLCLGHLARIRGIRNRDSGLLGQAQDRFTEAQALLPRSPDPLLGLADLYVYGLKDIDKGYQALLDAQKRGFALGPREKKQLADGYNNRGDSILWNSRAVRGLPQEWDQLQHAARDYIQAVDLYRSVAPYGNAAASAAKTQTSLDSVNARLKEITTAEAPAPASVKPPSKAPAAKSGASKAQPGVPHRQPQKPKGQAPG